MDVTFEGKTETGTDVWLTPPYIIEACGKFDLDPCSPINRPWDTAEKHFTINDDGLLLPWFGRVWCNPPYGNNIEVWLNKAALHGNCMVLIFARTETEAFQDHVFAHADALFFIKGRLRFHKVSGERGGSAGAPSVLVAYGKENSEILSKIKIKGKYIKL